MIEFPDSSGDDLRSRFLSMSAFVGFLFVILFARAWYLQIFNGRKFKAFSEQNRITIKRIPAMRGRILDRNGKVIADSRPSFDLTLTAGHSKGEIEKTLDEVGRLLSWSEQDRTDAEDKINASSDYDAVVIKRDMTRDQLALILTRQYALPGINVIHSPARAYPYGTHGSHLLGYLSEINREEFKKLKASGDQLYALGDMWGIAGVEKKYESVLRGKDGARPFVEDAAGREIGEELSGDLLPAFRPRDPEPGKDLVLSLDVRLQEAAEESFTQEGGAVVALDPANGDVLALVSKPEYAPENFVRGVSGRYWKQLVETPRNPLYDRALRGLYPPGSTFKMITSAALLETPVATPSDTVFCPGNYRLGREVKHCWQKAGHGWMDFHQALQHSCDVYFYEMGRRLGIDKLASMAKQFGFGQATGIGINREENGLVPTEEWKQKIYHQPWVGGETLSVAIGQGALQVTPIQLAVALSAMANGGTLYRPRVALRSQDYQGKKMEEYKSELRSKIAIKSSTRKVVLDALDAVVNDPGGTAYWTGRSTLVRIGGKTGTAQVVGFRSGVKVDDHAWFMAFAPVEDPKIVVVVIVENGGHGGTTAAPIAKKVIETYLGETS